jgi:hypothetical protein
MNAIQIRNSLTHLLAKVIPLNRTTLITVATQLILSLIQIKISHHKRVLINWDKTNYKILIV